MSLVFIIARLRNRYDLIDAAWGMAFISIALISYMTLPHALFSLQSLVTLLVVIWGLRLSIHIYQRWNRNSMEDKRYHELRDAYMK